MNTFPREFALLGFVFLLADATVKAVLLLGLAAAVALLSRRASAAFRHLVWALALGCVLVLPLLSRSLPHWHLAVRTPVAHERQAALPPPPALPAPSATGGVTVSEKAASNGTPSSPSAAESQATDPPALTPPQIPPAPAQTSDRISWMDWVALVWAAGALLALARMGRGAVCVRTVAATSTRAPEAHVGMLRAAMEAMRVNRPVALLTASAAARVAVPITSGVLRPVIVVPPDASAWPADKVQAALLHELAHVRRGDWLLQTLAHLVCAIHWFNPLVWLAARRMRAESEAACDDLVLAAGVSAPEYARHLLDVALGARDGRRIGLGAVAMAQTARIEGRLRAVLAAGLSREAVGKRVALSALAAAFVLVLPLAALRIEASAQGRWSSLPVVTDANELQLHEGFTLRYAVTITDLTSSKMQQQNYQQLRADYQKLLKKDPYFQPVPADYYAPFSYYQSHRNKIRHAVITISAFDGRLVYQKEENGEIFTLTYSGGQETRQSINHHTAIIETGFDFAGMENIPLPAVGIPYVPLLTQVKLLHGSDSQQTWLAECPQIGSAGYNGAPWVEPDTVRTIKEEGTWKITDIDNGAGEWQYLRHQQFQGLWIASEMRFTHYVSDPTISFPPARRFSSYEEGNKWIDSTRIPTQSCSYYLISASNDWSMPDAVSTSTDTTKRDKQSAPTEDTSRFTRMDDLYIQEALHLRYHLQGWAESQKTLLGQLAQAQPNGHTALRISTSLNGLPFPLWQGDPRPGHVWDGDPRVGHDGQKPLFQAEGPSAQNNPASKDFEIACSLNPIGGHVVLWASGRITRNTEQTGSGSERLQEIVPAFFGAHGTINMASDPPPTGAFGQSYTPGQPPLRLAYGFRRYVSPPFAGGIRVTFLYPSCDTSIQQGWIDRTRKEWFASVNCFGLPPVHWAAVRGQTPIPFDTAGPSARPAVYDEFCSLDVGNVGEVRFPTGTTPVRQDRQWGAGRHSVSLTDRHSHLRFYLTHSDGQVPTLFQQTDPVIFGSFRVLPPGAAAAPLSGSVPQTANTVTTSQLSGSDTAAAHVARGEQLQEKGQPRDGIPEFRRAVQIDPNNADAQKALAAALYEIKDKRFRTRLRDTTVGLPAPPTVLDEAILHMTRAVALRPNDAGWHSTLATYLSNSGRHREAVAEYRRSMHLLPPLSPADIKPSTDGSISGKVEPWYDAYWTLGKELIQTGQYQEAAINLRQALRLNPSDCASLLWLGDALNGGGHRAEARAAWRKSLAARPPKSYYQRQARARLAGH